MTDDDLVHEFRTRLKHLYDTCSLVARQEGASFHDGAVPQNPFDAKSTVIWVTTPLPTATMRKDNMKVKIQPKEIHQNPTTTKHYAELSVRREIVGQGHPTSPTCWTDLENLDDTAWYVGPPWQKNGLVDKELIKSWLYYSGAPLIW